MIAQGIPAGFMVARRRRNLGVRARQYWSCFQVYPKIIRWISKGSFMNGLFHLTRVGFSGSCVSRQLDELVSVESW